MCSCWYKAAYSVFMCVHLHCHKDSILPHGNRWYHIGTVHNIIMVQCDVIQLFAVKLSLLYVTMQISTQCATCLSQQMAFFCFTVLIRHHGFSAEPQWQMKTLTVRERLAWFVIHQLKVRRELPHFKWSSTPAKAAIMRITCLPHEVNIHLEPLSFDVLWTQPDSTMDALRQTPGPELKFSFRWRLGFSVMSTDESWHFTANHNRDKLSKLDPSAMPASF